MPPAFPKPTSSRIATMWKIKPAGPIPGLAANHAPNSARGARWVKGLRCAFPMALRKNGSMNRSPPSQHQSRNSVPANLMGTHPACVIPVTAPPFPPVGACDFREFVDRERDASACPTAITRVKSSVSVSTEVKSAMRFRRSPSSMTIRRIPSKLLNLSSYPRCSVRNPSRWPGMQRFFPAEPRRPRPNRCGPWWGGGSACVCRAAGLPESRSPIASLWTPSRQYDILVLETCQLVSICPFDSTRRA
jgi:hypothetical protein